MSPRGERVAAASGGRGVPAGGPGWGQPPRTAPGPGLAAPPPPKGTVPSPEGHRPPPPPCAIFGQRPAPGASPGAAARGGRATPACPPRDRHLPPEGPGHSPWGCLGRVPRVTPAGRVRGHGPVHQPFRGTGSGDSLVLLPSILGRTIHFGSFVLCIPSSGRRGNGDPCSPPLPRWRRSESSPRAARLWARAVHRTCCTPLRVRSSG